MASTDATKDVLAHNRPRREKRSMSVSSSIPYVTGLELEKELAETELAKVDSEPLIVQPKKKPRPSATTSSKDPPPVEQVDTGAATGSGCLVCGLDDNHSKLLLCEVCSGEYHTYCLVPPLRSIPDADWYCERCKHVDNLDARVASLPDSYSDRFGEICWAQGGAGYGWWPACIYDPRLTIGSARIQAMKNLGRKHLVYFFECAEAPFEILPDAKLMFWEQGIMEDCHLGKSAKSASKTRFDNFRAALHAASIEENKPKEFRLDWNHQEADSTLLPPSPRSKGKKKKDKDKKKKKPQDNKKKPNTFQESVSAEAGMVDRPAKRRRSASSAPREEEYDKDDGEMYCSIFRERDSITTTLGFVRLHSRQKSTFAQLRRVIENDLVPDAISKDWKWRFLVPNLGPLSTKQETKFGPLLPFLLQTLDPQLLGNGTLQSPVHISVVDAPNPTH